MIFYYNLVIIYKTAFQTQFRSNVFKVSAMLGLYYFLVLCIAAISKEVE